MGAMMGGTVGVCLGFLMGTMQIIRFGPTHRGIMGTLGQYMLTSGSFFGFFMSIGSVIRSQEQLGQRRIQYVANAPVVVSGGNRRTAATAAMLMNKEERARVANVNTDAWTRFNRDLRTIQN
ncbi:hypothetical protein GQ42DRAFT_161935 [Ramicandelaber brevisporus]|nr:hypothetical protein GQ42DRAFT_161935 [Ramicandelaber brevisporus]